MKTTQMLPQNLYLYNGILCSSDSEEMINNAAAIAECQRIIDEQKKLDIKENIHINKDEF